ncbi:peptidase S8 and S53 subtilisin kexin sedolisin [Cyclobacterium marinum DSM 745]|uniref:Peptidase S8 and S53 subtilisin kexin sedolisin n=2 Tax=Cyclobacterium marinum TaxID=104 RepID=G0J5N2_CYCMS|nr:peptidase S8 and S53 subtilisin kexin sedolisin [Cyclobacterium marinum DSM 745]
MTNFKINQQKDNLTVKVFEICYKLNLWYLSILVFRVAGIDECHFILYTFKSMERNFKKYFYAFLLGIFLSGYGSSYAFSGEAYLKDSLKTPDNWFLLDPIDDGIMGTGTEKAYEKLLQGKSPKATIVVAVIDSGIDIEHEDLQGKIWTNEDEIAGNGIDDDNNGYIDDVHGWNFIGGADGSQVDNDSHELTREYVRLKALYGDMKKEDVKRRNREEFEYWENVSKNFEEAKEKAASNYNMYNNMMEGFSSMADLVKEEFEVADFSLEDLANFESEDEKITAAIDMLKQMFGMIRLEDASINTILAELGKAVKHFEVQAKYAYNTDFDPRGIVGDDPDNYKEKYYGNNDPTGPDPSHGTHVAGIIAANRGNDLGIEGIADHVLIMPIRAVPNGDERDKDIANSIRYAVDNGAHVINMSFGKSYSPGKKYVDKAVKYAERKGVLLIHAAGNSSKEVTPGNNFPNRWFAKRGVSDAWIEVGASGPREDENLAAEFSNFSKEGVDLFAPGVDIYSTIPDSGYENNSGTSMAAPTVAGVAALLLAYYPDLKPTEVRKILTSSVYKVGDDKVHQPGNEELVGFGDLSQTGGIVNAYQAIKMAEELAQ